jgi:hypothetical protein
MGIKIAREPFTKQQEELLANHGLSKDNVNVIARFFADTMFRMSGGDNDMKYYTDEKGDHKIRMPWLTDINASRVEHIFGSYFGGTGRFVGNTVQTIIQAGKEDQEIDFRNVPFISSFIRVTPESKWRTIEKWQKMRESVEYRPFLAREYYNIVKGSYIKEDPDETKEKWTNKYVWTKGNVKLATRFAIVNQYEKVLDLIYRAYDFNSKEGSAEIVKYMEDAMSLIKEYENKIDADYKDTDFSSVSGQEKAGSLIKDAEDKVIEIFKSLTGGEVYDN